VTNKDDLIVMILIMPLFIMAVYSFYTAWLITTKEAEAYKKGWAERGDYEFRKYENAKD